MFKLGLWLNMHKDGYYVVCNKYYEDNWPQFLKIDNTFIGGLSHL